MNSRQKEYLWLFVMMMFYILTGSWGVYSIGLVFTWPLFAIPMSLFLIKTKQKELTALVGVILSVAISFISTSMFSPLVVAAFLLFIVMPAIVFSILYQKKVMIPQIIIVTTMVYFSGLIVFLTVAKLLGVDYSEVYFDSLDIMQDIWNRSLADVQAQELLPPGEDVLEISMKYIASAILVAKRTYPASLFIISLVTSTIHLLIVQLIARIRSWSRPAMKEILNVGLSPAAAWILVILWFATAQMGNTDTIWTFATESMLRVLFVLFQVIGIISVIVMIQKLKTTGMVRVMLSVIGMLWLIFNPALLIIFGCMDSIFNFRKVKTFI